VLASALFVVYTQSLTIDAVADIMVKSSDMVIESGLGYRIGNESLDFR
jgi:hypothetical protein